MIYGHRHQCVDFQIPIWAGKLNNLYWVIRNEGRNKTKRRMYYRLVLKEKQKLAEQGIDQELIHVVCKYLSSLNPVYGAKMQLIISNPTKQSFLVF